MRFKPMQFGLAVVSTTVGGIPDVISHGITGLLVKPGNVAALTGTLEQLINDKKLRYELGNNARKEFLNNYTLDHFYDGLEAVFDQVLNEGKPTSKTAPQRIKERV